MRILITTGIYPPEIGGPALYASELARLWKEGGERVLVAVASRFSWIPVPLRHIAFFKLVFWKALRADVILALDTFSAAMPAFYAASVLRKPFIIRVGGDFLWEHYVERTKKDITLRAFCENVPDDLSLKERIILRQTRKVLRGAHMVVFSVDWYESLARKLYGPFRSVKIIENPNGPKEVGILAQEKTFLFAGRRIFLKNTDRLKKAFLTAKKNNAVNLLEYTGSREGYLECLRSCYAVAIPSLSEVSPNTALDALRFGKPILLTKENGYSERFGKAAVLVDPTDESSICLGIELLSNSAVYEEAKKAAEGFPCTRLFKDVSREFLISMKKICES